MSQYIILTDMREENQGVSVVKNINNETAIFNDIADATETCKNNAICNTFPCEIIDLDDLRWCD